MRVSIKDAEGRNKVIHCLGSLACLREHPTCFRLVAWSTPVLPQYTHRMHRLCMTQAPSSTCSSCLPSGPGRIVPHSLHTAHRGHTSNLSSGRSSTVTCNTVRGSASRLHTSHFNSNSFLRTGLSFKMTRGLGGSTVGCTGLLGRIGGAYNRWSGRRGTGRCGHVCGGLTGAPGTARTTLAGGVGGLDTSAIVQL